jgi:replication initiation and membrane attachment protein DnaB
MIDHSFDIPDTELISHIIYNAQPRIYQTLLTLVKRDLTHNVQIQLEDLKRDIRQIYNQNTNSTFSNGKNKELVLSAVQRRGKPRLKKVFKGYCRICGKKGHKAADC